MAKVTSSNPFDLLGEGDFDGEINPAKLVTKKDTPTSKQTTSSIQSKSQQSRSNNPKKGNKSQGPTVNVSDDFQGSKPRNFSDKKSSKAPRNPRGRGREFDRHSATGRVDTDKAINQGWGHATENLDKTAKVDSDGREADSSAEPIVDPEDSFKTLEEYYAEVKAHKADADSKSVRKANEGVDESKWKDTKPLVKEEEDFFTGKSLNAKARKNKDKATKTFVEIEQTFNTPERRGERRSTRGPQRGNRGSDRAPKNSGAHSVSLNDESAFPSLG